jgi:hypothetical protein
MNINAAEGCVAPMLLNLALDPGSPAPLPKAALRGAGID